MPFYKAIRNDTETGRRTASNLLTLRTELDIRIPSRTVDSTLLLATWNLREFGGSKFGGRTDESLFYLAEIISHFDMVAIQEVRDDLDALDELMNKLGSWWKYLVSDVTAGAQGNNERHAFLYDTRKVVFGGLAGELVPKVKKKADGTLESDFAFARSPYLAGFRAGWFKFTICTQHFYYGKAKADDPQRLAEAKEVVKLLQDRMEAKDAWAYNTILLGDFNIFSTEDETFKAIEKGMFDIPASLKGTYTNAGKDKKPFDQIAFQSKDKNLQLGLAHAGTFPFYDFVYRDEDAKTYLPDGDTKEFNMWRTFQMSDHLPLWVEIFVDFGNQYLSRKAVPPEEVG